MKSTCCIEAIATDPASRGIGVASALLNYVFDHLPFRVFNF
ncbi:GNAT family N-acetyltransferase [Marinicrinis lubricantis]|uniref:GNAT family N-acetyltransferase n=1 Tax=Marinicrinis lubricantis TaxID=2086470 RepID=A0ABW1IPH6_9BACL